MFIYKTKMRFLNVMTSSGFKLTGFKPKVKTQGTILSKNLAAWLKLSITGG